MMQQATNPDHCRYLDLEAGSVILRISILVPTSSVKQTYSTAFIAAAITKQEI